MCPKVLGKLQRGNMILDGKIALSASRIAALKFEYA